jgi:hypothetical protein
LGARHGPRINEVWRESMHARLAGVLRGAESAGFWQRREGLHEGERPASGGTARVIGEEVEDTNRLTQMKAMLRAKMRRVGKGGDDGVPHGLAGVVLRGLV